jgi:polysaccharide biosynthesis transport protein
MNPQLPVPSLVDSDLLDFQEIWRTVMRYAWRIFGVAFSATILGVLYAFTTTPVYRATLTVLVESRPTRTVQFQEVYDPGYGTNEYYGTQVELLRSRELLGKAVDELKLASDPAFVQAGTRSLMATLMSLEWLPFLAEPDVAPRKEAPIEERERAIDVLRRMVAVSLTPRTQILQVNVESESPRLAQQIANVLGENFVNSGLETRLQATEHATRWLTDRLSELKTKLEQSERALQTYRDLHQLVNVGGARGLFEEDVVDNARKLRDAQRKKTELASTYWKIQQAGNEDAKLQDISALLLDATVQKAAENLLQSQQIVKQLQDRYGAKHPQMTAAQARLKAAEQSYYNQLRLAANGVKAEYEISSETERALTSVVESGKSQIRKLDRSDYELRALERDAQANRELYDVFLKRYKETDTASAQDTFNARVVDRATLPRVPVKPDKSKIVVLAAMAGLVVGLLLATLKHLLLETVRSPDHLEHATQLPVLSVLPPVSGLGRKASAPTLCIEQPRAPFAEGVRSIRASLYLSDVDKRMKKVMFTSALPREGKSSIASSFAAVLGSSERVVLIEADLRAPSLKKIFGIDKDAPGLVEVLTGQAKLEQALFHHVPSGIRVLPVAQIPANPAEVVASAAFAKLIDVFATRYDRIVFDTPPCQVASDTLLLAHRVDAVLFVIHGNRTGMRSIQTAIKHLRVAQAPLLGHILNQVDARRAYGYDGSYYVYGQYGT